MKKFNVVKNNVLNFGTVNEKAIVKFKFNLIDGMNGDNIDYIVPDCHVCTKLKYDKENNCISGTLDIEKARAEYTQGKTPLNKVIYVYENDGESQFKGDEETKERIFNSNKGIQKITIAGVVVK